MKRWMIAALALTLCASLCACAGSKPSQEETELQPLSPVMEEMPPASVSNAEDQTPLPPASETDALPEETGDTESLISQAQECIGRSVDELIAAIGEPESSEYAASCEAEDAEDGMLQYDGFYVWTLKTADEELVRDVYPDD